MVIAADVSPAADGLNGGAVYFGAPGAERLGWLHVPASGSARGAVVLCSSLGTEDLLVHRAFRMLGDELAERGIVVLRFDYRGTGDSAAELDDVGSTDAWIEDIAEATAFVRALGMRHVALAGMRLGATLAARAAALDGDIDALVMWDPCSGRLFLRQQQALRAVSLGAAPVDGDGVELLSVVLPTSLAESVRALTPPDGTSPLAGRALLLERGSRPVECAFNTALESTTFDRVLAAHQAEFVDVEPGEARLPVETFTTIISWLDAQLPDTWRPVVEQGQPEAVMHLADGSTITEQAVVFGERALFGVLAQPARGHRASAATVLFLNSGLLHHTGPGRLYVELARALAARGVRSLRFDLTGIGDSGGDHLSRDAYPPEALADLRQAIELACDGDASRAYIVGICSGAYHAAEVGIIDDAAGLCLLNPAVYFDPILVREVDGAPPVFEPSRPSHPFIAWLKSRRPVLVVGKSRPVDWVRERVDRIGALWRFLERLGLVHAPARILEELAAKDIPTLLVCDTWEARHFVRWQSRVRALEQAGKLRFQLLDGEDHSFFSAAARDAARGLVLAELIDAAVTAIGPAAVEGASTAADRPELAVVEPGP